MISGSPRTHSDVDALDLVKRDLLGQAVVELGGAGRFMSRDSRRDLEGAAVSQVLGDPGAAEAMGADLGQQHHLPGTALDHLERTQA